MRYVQGGGFTIIEMLVAMGVVAITLGIAAPAFNGIRLGTALAGAQRDVAAAVQNARWRAINTGATHTIDLSGSDGIAVTRSGTTVASVGLAQYYVSQTHTGGSTFDFDARGLIPSGTTTPITITLTNPRSVTKTVSVDRLGRITTS